MDDGQRAKILAGVGYVSGIAGALAPGLTAKAFGVNDASAEHLETVRMMSFRNVALAAAMSAVAGDDGKRKQFFTIAAGLFAVDTLASLLSGATGKVPARSALLLGATTGALAAVAAGGAFS